MYKKTLFVTHQTAAYRPRNEELSKSMQHQVSISIQVLEQQKLLASLLTGSIANQLQEAEHILRHQQTFS
jgi:ribosomal protein S3